MCVVIGDRLAFPAAEQLIERHIRCEIQYRWILRQHTGEALSLPTAPTPRLKTHGRILGSVTTTVTIQTWSYHSIVCAAPRLYHLRNFG
jgi:hypothetical protein